MKKGIEISCVDGPGPCQNAGLAAGMVYLNTAEISTLGKWQPFVAAALEYWHVSGIQGEW